MPNVKVVAKDDHMRIPDSASRVIMPVGNNTLNDLIFNQRNKSITEQILKSVRKIEEDVKEVMNKKAAKKSELKLHSYDEVTGELIDGDHPCHRECREGEEPMICYYQFSLEWYQTMSKACYNCPYNESDCRRQDCIPADGMNRAINVINRKMPGPAIEVNELSFNLHNLFSFFLKRLFKATSLLPIFYQNTVSNVIFLIILNLRKVIAF